MKTKRDSLAFAIAAVIGLGLQFALASPAFCRSAKSAGVPSAASPAAASSRPVRLDPKKTAQADLQDDQPQTFLIHAKTGQFIHAIISEKKGYLTVSLADPSGKVLAHNNTYSEAEPVSAIAESTGDFLLKVAPAEKGQKLGTFSVSLEALRHPKQEDRSRINAEHLSSDAFDLYFTPDPANKKLAISKWEESRQLWHSIGDARSEANTLKLLANAVKESDPQSSASDFEESARLFESAGDKSRAADSMIGAGQLYSKLGQQEKSIAAYQQVFALAKAVSQLDTQALALDAIGDAYKSLAGCGKIVWSKQF